MIDRRCIAAGPLLLALGIAVSGCGSASSSSTSTAAAATSTTRPAATTSAAAAPTTTSSGALVPEAQSAASGDIPDNQVFLTLHTPRYTIRYPEGWLQHTTPSEVTFRDKNNQLRIVTASGPAYTPASVEADLAAVAASSPSFHAASPRPVTLPAGRAFHVVYATKGAPDPVTGKRLTLTVDRYYVSRRGRRAIVDLGGPEGVDNVDAFRLIVESFRWR